MQSTTHFSGRNNSEHTPSDTNIFSQVENCIITWAIEPSILLRPAVWIEKLSNVDKLLISLTEGNNKS